MQNDLQQVLSYPIPYQRSSPLVGRQQIQVSDVERKELFLNDSRKEKEVLPSSKPILFGKTGPLHQDSSQLIMIADQVDDAFPQRHPARACS